MLAKLKKLLAKRKRNRPFIDFLGIGAQKSGTTWLYENLKHHPEIFMPEIKEIHFFDEHFAKGVEWYKALFTQGEGRKRGEITPAYSILDDDKIQYIKGLNKNLRLIYILRDPMERAWSAALMDMRRGNLKFEETPDIWFINHFNSAGSLSRGDYKECIKSWLKFFPKENFLILNYEDIKTNPKALLASCCAHLGVNPSHDFSAAEKKVFEGEPQALRTSLKKVLENLYSEKISEQKKFFDSEFGVTLYTRN